MKQFIFAALLVPIACGVSFGQEEDVDIEFGYDDFNNPTTIVVESDELTDDGIQIVEGELEVLGGEAFADNPGFITIATEDPGGERVNPGDAVSVRFLDASQDSETGVGFVNFYDATTGEIESVNQITVTPQNGASAVLNAGNATNDLVLLSVGSDGTTMSNSPVGDQITLPSGEIHNHLTFTLDNNVEGAYGLLFQFESEPADGSAVITSAPVWLIYNNGLDAVAFEEAVAAFSTVEEEMHSDIEFGYDDFNNPTTVLIESDELTSDGIQIVEGEFEDLLGDVFADNPGFITPVEEGLRVNPGDSVSLRFLDASVDSAAGVGFVSFYDADLGAFVPDTGRISISNQPGEVTVLDGESVAGGSDLLFLSLGSDGDDESNAADPDENEILGEGEIHNHLVFDLDGAAPGAYGLLFQFEVVPAGGGETITSAPVWLILNNGLDEEVFEEQAVAAFSAPVLLGDVNRDEMVNFLDISPFIAVLASGGFQFEADIDGNEIVNFLDISPFIQILSGGQ